MQPNEPADLITVLVLLLAYITGKEIASLIGAYAAIFLLACAGAALSLSGNEKELKPMQAIWYVTVRVLVALVLSVSLAEVLLYFAPTAKARIIVVPVAFLIGFIRDYESVRTWGSGIIRRCVDAAMSLKFGNTPKGPNDGSQ